MVPSHAFFTDIEYPECSSVAFTTLYRGILRTYGVIKNLRVGKMTMKMNGCMAGAALMCCCERLCK